MLHRVTIRPGLLDRLKRFSGIQDDDSFARLIGTSRATLNRIRSGQQEPSLQFIAGVCAAYGMSLGEVATITADPATAQSINEERLSA